MLLPQHKYIFICLILGVILTSCHTQKSNYTLLYDPEEVKQLSEKLEVSLSNIDKEDVKNMPLYAQVSLWLGTPYKYGGTSRQGIDCSGFVHLIYKEVYGLTIPRSTADMVKQKLPTIKNKKHIHTGDLVFFVTSKNKDKINHVGIYLKNGYFIHASTSKGVVVSNLEEDYYKKKWDSAGRIK